MHTCKIFKNFDITINLVNKFKIVWRLIMQIIEKIKTLNNMFEYLLWILKEDKTATIKGLHSFVKSMNKLSLEIENEIKNI